MDTGTLLSGIGIGIVAAAVPVALTVADRRRGLGGDVHGIYGHRAPTQVWHGVLVGAGLLVLMYVFVHSWPGEPSSAPGADIVFVLDVSRSMNARDALPSRGGHARRAIARAVSLATSGRFGLVAFSGDAVLACPLTTDRLAFVAALDSASGQSIQGGTAMGPALDRAVRILTDRSGPRAVVLVTDGENLSGTPALAVSSAKSAGIPVYTVGVGTAEGAVIPAASPDDGSLVRDRSGAVVTSRLDEATLRAIAEATGATYERLPTGASLVTLPSVSARTERTPLPRRIVVAVLALALGLLVAEQILRMLVGRWAVSA